MIRTSSNGINNAIIDYINTILFEPNNLVSLAKAFKIAYNRIVVNYNQYILPILKSQGALAQRVQNAYGATLNKLLTRQSNRPQQIGIIQQE